MHFRLLWLAKFTHKSAISYFKFFLHIINLYRSDLTALRNPIIMKTDHERRAYQMIAFYKLWDKMNRLGIRKKDLKDKKIVSGATINKMKNNEIVTTESIDKLCDFFQCQPGDILEFIPNTHTEENSIRERNTVNNGKERSEL